MTTEDAAVSALRAAARLAEAKRRRENAEVQSLHAAEPAIQVSRCALDTVVRHACAEAPRECCGFLLGAARLVREAVAARNIATPATSRFLIDPQDHFDTLRTARERELDILGFYHSHPHTAAWPSDTDRGEASYPGHLYLIVGLAAGSADVRLFRLVDGNFTEVSLVTLD